MYMVVAVNIIWNKIFKKIINQYKSRYLAIEVFFTRIKKCRWFEKKYRM